MALEIKSLNNTFEISGVLDKSNVKTFQTHFSNIFQQKEEVVININELKKVDVEGVVAFEELYKQSLQLNKRFFITGYGSRDMYEHLSTIQVA